MKRSVQKWLPVSMAALMMLPPVMPALAAEDSTEKEEVVYATLDANGDMDSLYVVNAFNLDAPQTITDYGTYTQTKNLSTSDSLVYQDGKVIKGIWKTASCPGRLKSAILWMANRLTPKNWPANPDTWKSNWTF